MERFLSEFMHTTQGLFDSSVYNNLGTFKQSPEPLEMLACVSLVVWPEKNRQMSTKGAQNLFH